MEQLVGSLVVLFMLWLGPAIGCGFGTKSIMMGKGRSGTAGFWLGFCLGLTGLLIGALLSPTPEHEARKMQIQMQMMGIPAPPQAASFAVAGSMPTSFATTAPVTATASSAASSIIAVVVCAAYLLGWIGRDEFRYLFGSSTLVSLLVFAGGLGLAILALVKKSAVLVGLASGVALGISGLGFAALAGLIGQRGVDASLMVALPFDIAALVGAGLVVARSRRQLSSAAPAWWKPTVIGLAAAGGLLTVFASEPYRLTMTVANLSVWGGFMIAGLCLLREGRTPLAFAIGWCATTVLFLVGTEFRGLSWRASSALQGLVMMIAFGILGVAVWALTQTEPDVATGPPVFATQERAQQFVAVAPLMPPPPAPPAPSLMSPPVLISAPPPMAPMPSPDVTLPRPRPAVVLPTHLRFATGEVVALTGTLIVGRAPIAPARNPAAPTLAVADPSLAISSTHCQFSLEDGAVWVEDLGSTNGTEIVSPTGTTHLASGQLAGDSHG